jgi:hypothetical protein
MKRVNLGGFWKIPVVAFIAFAATIGIARSDTDRFQNIRRVARSDAQLDADSAYCQSETGENSNGKPTSPAFKHCMLTRGWKYLRTNRSASDGQWWDSDQNLWCWHSSFLGVASTECSNTGR